MLNAQLKDGVLHFQDFVQSSAQLDIGNAVEVPVAGPYTAQRFNIVSKTLADCGTVYNFVAVAL